MRVVDVTRCFVCAYANTNCGLAVYSRTSRHEDGRIVGETSAKLANDLGFGEIEQLIVVDR